MFSQERGLGKEFERKNFLYFVLNLIFVEFKFDKNGKYRFGRTKSRIVSKKLPKALETKLIGHIPKCQSEAEKKFPQKQEHIDSIQYFQACVCIH
jgi:hypothetical protein